MLALFPQDLNLVVLFSMVCASVVSHDLESSDHFTDCEETNSLRQHYTSSDHCLVVNVARLVQHCAGVGWNARRGLREESARIPGRTDHGIEVRLKGRNASVEM